jgi:hypothetical protein
LNYEEAKASRWRMAAELRGMMGTLSDEVAE